MLQQVITKQDVHEILKEVTSNLPSHKYDVGQKVISELCSKLTEQVTASHYAKKLAIEVSPGKHDVDPDVLFKFPSQHETLEIKVAMGTGDWCKWRGGGLSDRSSEYLYVARNRECTEFFVALCHTSKKDWLLQNTAYYAPYVTEEIISDKNATVLWGSFGTKEKGKRKGKPTIILEKL